MAADAELTDYDRGVLEERLAAYQGSPDAGSSWEEVAARIRPRLNQ